MKLSFPTMFPKSIILCLAVVISFSCGLERLPDYIEVCHKDANAVQCIISNVERIRPHLMNGIPELDIPSIEPLALGDLLVSESTNNNGLKITAKDIKAYGGSDFKVRKLNIVRWGEEYQFEMFLPHLYVEGVYNVNGQILLIPIKGSGKFTGNFTSCSGSVRLVSGKYSSMDETVQITKFDIKIKLGNGYIALKNLFNGDKVLGNAINDVINQNFDVLSKDIVPLIEKALQRHFKKIANKISSRFTYGQLFPVT